MFFTKSFARYKARAAARADLRLIDAIKRCRDEAQRLIRYHGLNPSDPLIVAMLESLPDMVREHREDLALSGLRLNEQMSRMRGGQTLVFFRSVWWGWFIDPVRLAEHFLPDLRRRINSVVVDEKGTHLFEDDHELCVFTTGRLQGQGSTTHADSLLTRNALLFVEHFTGVELDHRNLDGVGHVTATRHGDQWVATAA